jgi:excisionase family DNA binding protein
MPKIDARQAAVELGISRYTVGALARRGELPHYRIGRRIVFDEEDLQAWLWARRQPRVPGSRRRGTQGSRSSK